MKLGRYETGYWFVMMVIIAVAVVGMAQIRIYLPEVPEWAVVITFTFLFLVGTRLYSTWYLRHIRDNMLAQWLNSQGLASRVTGNWSPTLHIKGEYHQRPYHIEITHMSRYQVTTIHCQVKYTQMSDFSLVRRKILIELLHRTGSIADQAFNDRFVARPDSHEIFSDAAFRDRLVQIQTKVDVVDLVKYKKGKLSLYVNEILTDGEKLDGALEAVWLFAEKVDHQA